MSISLRLTLAFCVAMGAVLLFVSTFVVALQRHSMDGAIRAELVQRYDDAKAIDIRSLTAGIDADEGAAQLYGPSGALRAGSPSLTDHPLLTRRQVRLGMRSMHVFDVDSPTHPGRRLRVLAGPARSGGVVVVATSLGPRNESLDDLVQVLIAGGIVVLIAGGSLAFWLARHALAPVERLRQQAAATSEIDVDRTLDVPQTGDEVSRLAVTLNDLLGRLHASVERERAFVADAGHELRTPLALLVGEIELALGAARDDENRDTLLRLQRDTQRLVTLTEDLLAMSRPASGTPREVELRPAIADAVARLARAANGVTPVISLEVEDDLVVHANPGQLDRVVANLVENAVRHASTDITITARRIAGGGVEIAVRDFGEGFPAGFEQVAFERFTRGDEARTGPGSGLGLAIVKAIVDAHGGTVRAANATPGPGAVVSVQLPGAAAG